MQARQKRTAIRRVVLGNMGGARREAGGENLKYTLYRACELHRIPSCTSTLRPLGAIGPGIVLSRNWAVGVLMVASQMGSISGCEAVMKVKQGLCYGRFLGLWLLI